ncbi:putative methyltransferase, YaeB/AF_0241 family [Methanocella conradii HZ254]|uniref:Methyltransferase, YaeB/AF_0241 family n=1 Tax=Methanocella conradii (strain DSM 24694 / JCM 17849 / CGMCC 1.5162 / HZ254) TaxID=1041930 RepID=H8I6N7_METCZ|nr:tRNA (N6-threonylcarbamoyladenosine(37)-N6)-methyltransferase TrmO [Methanocella conradii]AFC98929.1 putative methyltransferase, YaeB/AF_0241 family [Methanocella conradii HZ254]MDI6898093.1 tRNA (N6-threonylcarbamoyladenosine(37)-N6)-methyltransferase TrmO [Methanocella conradii]
MEVSLKVIGVIRSPFRQKDETPIQSVYSDAPGAVEVYPEYAEGLEGLEGFSHVYLVYYFDRAEARALRQKPFLDGSRERGIFATRHFNRPNPIGLSIVKLCGVKDNLLDVSGIDVLDGTPLLDIKPYVREFDRLDDIRCGWYDELGDHSGREHTPAGLRRQ